MTQIVTRPLREDKDGIEGYLAGPECRERGPGLVLIHQHPNSPAISRRRAYGSLSSGIRQSFPISITCSATRRKRISRSRAPSCKTRRPIPTSSGRSPRLALLPFAERRRRRAGRRGRLLHGRPAGDSFCVAATPAARAFCRVPSVGTRRGADWIRPRHPYDAAGEIKCP